MRERLRVQPSGCSSSSGAWVLDCRTPDQWAEGAGKQRQRCAPFRPPGCEVRAAWRPVSASASGPGAIPGPDGQWEATGRQRVPLGLLVTVARHQAGALVRAAMVAWRKGVQTGSRAQR